MGDDETIEHSLNYFLYMRVGYIFHMSIWHFPWQASHLKKTNTTCCISYRPIRFLRYQWSRSVTGNGFQLVSSCFCQNQTLPKAPASLSSMDADWSQARLQLGKDDFRWTLSRGICDISDLKSQQTLPCKVKRS